MRASSWHALFHNSVLHSISDLHLNSESSDYLHVRSGPNVSLSYKQADPSYTVDSATRVTFPDFGSRWTACKDAAGRQTRRATSDRVAHYRRGVFRSLSVPNVFYSDVLSFRSIYRILLQIFGHVDQSAIDRPCVNFKGRGVSS